jgi:hypothetical protein
MSMDDSVFNSVVLYLMLDPDNLPEQFRSHILDDINTQMNILHQVGVDFSNGLLEIEDSSTTWNDLMAGNAKLNMLKTFIQIGVRLEFDPPSNSFLYDALKKHYDEVQWRITIQVENSGRTL